MNSPFSQPTFGKTTTSSFAAPAFGSTGSSLFGSNTSTAGSLFGGAIPTPVFGQAQTTQPSAFGFGASTTSNNLFGTQQNANTSLFGGTTTSAFGQNKPAFGSFGSPSTSLFGQQQQPQATTSLFGQPSGTTTSGIFGSSGGFGSNATAQTMGTPIKFVSTSGTDTMVKGSLTQTVNTRHHCITCMKEYESKSLEELRLEDYVLNRKGPQQTPQQTGLFGASTQPLLFGSGASTSAAGSGLFQDKPLFAGTPSMGFGSGTTVFGSPNQQTGSLFGKPAGFGAVTTTTGSGFTFNTTTTANPFGATQQKQFGTAAPQANLFGTSSTQPSTFGTQSTVFGNFISPQNQGTSLYNPNKAPFISTTNPGFSFCQNTSTNQPSSLFNKTTGTTNFGTFTGSSSSGFSGGNMFGTNQNALYGQSLGKPNTGFTFGHITPATTGLGAGLGMGGQTLFGNTNKPGPFGSGTGLFGGGGSAFGTSSNFGLGSGLGTSLGLGGNTLMGGTGANPSTSQQGSLSSVHEQILALASMPFGDTPLFRNLLPVTGKADELLKPANAAPKANASSNQLKVTPRGNTKLRVKPLATLQPSKKALFIGLDEECSTETDQQSPCTNTKRLMLKPYVASNLQNGSITPIFPEVTPSSQDANKENITHQENIVPGEEWTQNHTDKSREKNEEKNSLDAHNPGRAAAEASDSVADFQCARVSRSSLNYEVKENSNASTTTSEESQEAEEYAPAREDQPSHPTGIILNRVGYYTIPSLDELATLVSEDGSCIVDNFTVGREGYGNVYFPDSFDVSGLNLDEIVHFRHKEIVLYPDDQKKPPVGEGLNRRAQVTLDRVWPMDKSTHEPITSPERLMEMDYEAKLQRVCAKLHTRFLEYRPQTGSWVFKVDHFSKYGLSDSDDDDDGPISAAKQLKPGSSAAPAKPGLVLPQQTSGKEQSQPGLACTFLAGGSPPSRPVLLEDDQEMEEGVPRHPDISPNESSEDLDAIQQSPTAQIARQLGQSSHNVQLMKAAFFMDEEMESEEDYMKLAQLNGNQLLHIQDHISEGELDDAITVAKLANKSLQLFRNQLSSPQVPHRAVATQRALPADSSAMQEITTAPAILPPPVEYPKTVVLKYPHHLILWEHTSAHETGSACIADIGLFKGRSFRVGWGPNSTFVTLTTQHAAGVQPLSATLPDLSSYTCGRTAGDTSPSIVQRLRLSGGELDYETSFCDTVEGHLEIELQHSNYVLEGDCPQWSLEDGVDALHAHTALSCRLDASCSNSVSLLTYTKQVWELCAALWGRLPSLDEGCDSNSHHTVMVRKEAVSEWLEKVVLPKVKHETSNTVLQLSHPNDSESHVPTVLSHLSAKNLVEACDKAQSCSDYYTVMLLAQSNGSQAVRQLLQQQLKYWQDVEADAFINRERLKMLMHVAGIPLFSSTHGTINICENLDWKRCFALHLWYICSPMASVTDALQKYEIAFSLSKDMYAQSPNPPYADNDLESEINDARPVYDLCYHLLKLYSARSHPLDKLLNPATHTADPLDYRLSWFLQQVLHAVGYVHLSSYSGAHLHTSFAIQLETHGLWHWAVFVLLHLKERSSRKAAVLDMLGRHIELSDSGHYLDKEDFLMEKLKIPSEWIFQAKATLATVKNEYCKAAWYLMKSGQLNEGHEVIRRCIASDAIINENYEYLRHLLEPLIAANPVKTVSDWNNGGQILWDYLKIVEEVNNLLANPNLVNGYRLEKLHPRLTSLCARINMLPCPTTKDRLCQAEIAVRTTHLVRNVMMLQSDDTVSSRVLTRLVTQLPLPEDCTRDELNQIVHSVVGDLMPPVRS